LRRSHGADTVEAAREVFGTICQFGDKRDRLVEVAVMKMKATRQMALILGVAFTSVAIVAAQDAEKVQATKAASKEPAASTAKVDDAPKEAPAGFTKASNGFEDQDGFDKDRTKFEEVEAIADGLGPVYNATSCVGCHQNPITGSSSQIAELRAGHLGPDKKFVDPPGGSLIHQRAIDASIQEHVRPEDELRTLRMSVSVLGDGFVECISDDELEDYSSKQPAGLQGTFVLDPAVVSGTKKDDGSFDFTFNNYRIGRFGWKCQEASLINFSAGAYLNEMGITNPLQPEENTSQGRDVTPFDNVLDPEDKVDPKDDDNKVHPFGDDVKAFARFMRSSRVPPRDFSTVDTQDVKDGEEIFRNDKTLGCAVCHRPDYVTPKEGTPIVGRDGKTGSDMEKVLRALGNKKIHPFSDFLLHDIGTGDGIVQAQHAQRQAAGLPARQAPRSARPKAYRAAAKKGEAKPQASEVDPQETANMIRTAPLWGLRTRPQMMHDGLSLTLDDAIERHMVNAGEVQLPGNYKVMATTPEGKEKQRKLKAFLRSL
jgi:CxxC motif-containing protein (DUF1111 family)